MNFALITLDPLTVLKEFFDIPDPLVWPNGDATHGMSPGYQHQEWHFVSATLLGAPNEFYSTTRPYTFSFDGDLLTATPTITPQPLTEVRGILCARLDALAEATRQSVITSGSGQAMVYLQKQAEAQACLKDPLPNPVNYPLLTATVGIEGATVTDVANLVATTAASWTTKAGQIERARLTGKAAINAAASIDAAISAYSDATFS